MKILSYEHSSAPIQTISLETLASLSHGVVFFGLADDQGIKNVGGRVGASQGPASFRRKFCRLRFPHLPFPVYDLGDLQPENTIEETHRAARDVIGQIHAAGHSPVIIGGGHDLAFPEAAALLDSVKKPIRFVNLDAHLDVRDTGKGITSGSPWYLLAESPEFQKSKSEIFEVGIQPHCNAVELQEYARKKKFSITWFSELRGKDMAKYLTSLLKGKTALVSLDIDSVRWSDAPGCSAPQNTGFTADEAIAMSFAAGSAKAVRSFGIYELSPPLDREEQTAALVARCAYAFLEGYSTRFKHSRLQSKNHGAKEKVRRRN